MSFPSVQRTGPSLLDRVSTAVTRGVSDIQNAPQNTRVWVVATAVSAYATAKLWSICSTCSKAQRTFTPVVRLLGFRMPQVYAVSLTAVAAIFATGLFAVSSLMLSRRVEQFQVQPTSE